MRLNIWCKPGSNKVQNHWIWSRINPKSWKSIYNFKWFFIQRWSRDKILSKWILLSILFSRMIHWKAIKLKTVTTSSTEAELLVPTITAKECIWWIRFSQNLDFKIESPIILCDNQQTLRLLRKETPKLATKLKHIDIHQF